MGVREKQAWAMLVISVAGLGVYLTLVLAARDGQPLDEVRYQPLMLGTIGAAIVAGIITAIVFAIQANLAGETDDADERDKAIDRFGTNVSQAFLVIGGLAGLLMAMAEWDWFWIANTIYLGFTLSGILEGVAKVTAYRRGLPW
jgi:MFS family permease